MASTTQYFNLSSSSYGSQSTSGKLLFPVTPLHCSTEEVTTGSLLSTLDDADDDDIWIMPARVFITSVVMAAVQFVTGIISNILLIITICYSPSLRTPPNAYLVNICCNNCTLCLCILISFTSALVSLQTPHRVVHPAFGQVQMFLLVTCFLQYCAVFASIGFYRCKMVKHPEQSTKARNRRIINSIVFGWTVSVTFSVLYTVSYRSSPSALSWNPFRKYFYHNELKIIGYPNSSQTALFYIMIFVILLYIAVIIRSYHYIIKTLLKSSAITKNKVRPRSLSASTTSDGNDFMVSAQRSYRPDFEESLESCEITSGGLFSISNGNVQVNNFAVHYQKKQQTIMVEDTFALENPMKAQALKEFPSKRKPFTSQLSNASQGSRHNSIRPSEFTDISPGAELNRFQNIKNRKALHNQTLRRDRINLGSATKNSFIMLMTFVLCSLPMFVCSVPGALKEGSMLSLSRTLTVCQLICYLNAPAYPIWYLVFSKRVRRCLIRLYDSALLKLYSQ